MSSKEIYLKRLKIMQATARNIKPAPKSATKAISLSAESGQHTKKEVDCQF